MDRPGLIVLAGPTASGKSDLALRLAERVDGTIINADSMQLYRDLRILTARPTPEEEARLPHRLYGVLDAAAPGSVGDWLLRAEDAIVEARKAGRVPIVVGGSGLYIEALLEGIAPVPDIPDVVRDAVRASFRELGRDGLFERLLALDPKMAARLRARDPQRVMRAIEVLLATGRSLGEWHAEPRWRPDLPPPVRCHALLPAREALRSRVAVRLGRMLAGGALAELRALRERRLTEDLPLMRAVAVPDLLAHLAGDLTLAEATARAIHATRRYAKRQETWIRHRLPRFMMIRGFGEEVNAASIAMSGNG
jgi:tRNA dimethylallyltransferase